MVQLVMLCEALDRLCSMSVNEGKCEAMWQKPGWTVSHYGDWQP